MRHVVATIAIVVAGACTTVMNWIFSFQLGTNALDSYTWAVFSVALDVAKWLMLPYAALAWTFHKPRAAAAASIWFISTIYSFTAAVGFAALNRDTAMADRKQQAELRTTIETMKLSPRWQSSAACADATTAASKEFCTRYAGVVAQLKPPTHDADPQSALLARLTGLQPDTVRFVLSIFLATACEIISALGFFAILTPTRQPIATTPPPTWHPPKWSPPASAMGRDGARHGEAGQNTPRRDRPRPGAT